MKPIREAESTCVIHGKLGNWCSDLPGGSNCYRHVGACILGQSLNSTS